MSQSNSPKTNRRKNERAKMNDVIEIVLIKGNGSIITNEPKPITEEFLRQMVEKMETI